MGIFRINAVQYRTISEHIASPPATPPPNNGLPGDPYFFGHNFDPPGVTLYSDPSPSSFVERRTGFEGGVSPPFGRSFRPRGSGHLFGPLGPLQDPGSFLDGRNWPPGWVVGYRSKDPLTVLSTTSRGGGVLYPDQPRLSQAPQGHRIIPARIFPRVLVQNMILLAIEIRLLF